MINEYMDYVERRMKNPKLWKELGLDAEQEAEITANVHDLLADWLSQCRKMGEHISLTADGQQITGMEDIMNQMKSGVLDHAEGLLLSRDSSEIEKDIPADAEKIFERSGWDHVSEWIGELPNLGNGKQKYFVFRLREDSPAADTGFPTILLGVMAVRYDAMNGGMTCMISPSFRRSYSFTSFSVICGISRRIASACLVISLTTLSYGLTVFMSSNGCSRFRTGDASPSSLSIRSPR